MKFSRKTATLAIAVISLIGMSGIALAEHEDAKEDTEFSFGYDEANQALVISTSSNDGLYECVFENGALTATYGEPDDQGVFAVDELDDADGVKEFDPRAEHELADDLEPAESAYPYQGADGECGATAISVTGPNGQVNHGQFMKAFNSLINMKGHGCLNRILAQSDLGKTDSTKIKTGDADPEFVMSDTGEVTFLTFEADCVHGKKDKNSESEKADVAKEKGKSAKKAKDSTKGKSAEAPGKNK
jgi:hypothetical protein